MVTIQFEIEIAIVCNMQMFVAKRKKRYKMRFTCSEMAVCTIHVYQYNMIYPNSVFVFSSNFHMNNNDGSCQHHNIVSRLQAFLRKPNRETLFATIGQHRNYPENPP